jgi:hypothetical protein
MDGIAARTLGRHGKSRSPRGGLKTRPCPSQRPHSGVLAGTKIAKFEQTNDHLFFKQLVRSENRQLPEAFALRCELVVGQ